MEMKNRRGILASDSAEAFEWIVTMVDACAETCVKAEEVAYGGIPVRRSVGDVVSEFNGLRAALHYQVQLISGAVKRFGHHGAPVWKEMEARLFELVKRCAIAGELVEQAHAASTVAPSAAAFAGHHA